MRSSGVQVENRGLLSLDSGGSFGAKSAFARAIKPYEDLHEAFLKVLESKREDGQTDVPIDLKKNRKSRKIVPLDSLQELAEGHLALISDPSKAGYVPCQVFSNLLSIYNFAPHSGSERLQLFNERVNEYINREIPRFHPIIPPETFRKGPSW